MAIPKVTTPQTDFSGGEFDLDVQHSEDPALRNGGRTCANFRILNSRKLADRPGRSVKFVNTNFPRCEEVLMESGSLFFISFGADGGGGVIQIRNAAGAVVATTGSLPWTLATVGKIVWAVQRRAIYITYPGMQPRVLSWDGVSVWSIANYSETIAVNQKRTPFYRLAPPNITMFPTGVSGAIFVYLSAPYFNPGHANTRMRFCNRQITITAVLDTVTAQAIVNEVLPGSQVISFVGDPSTVFSVGDVVRGSISDAKGIISQVSAGMGGNIHIQLLGVPQSVITSEDVIKGLLPPLVAQTKSFIVAETIIGPGGSMLDQAGGAVVAPEAVTIWDEQVMDNYHGWPASCFSDQGRLGFCDFPALPSGVAWSSINSPTDLAVGANPSDGIFEIIPNKGRVLYVVPGPESSEFVFCDNGLYYIPISATNPLKPGSIAFNLLSRDGAAQVQPRAVQEVLIYVGAGGETVMAVLASGAYNRPYQTRTLSDLHSHLINAPIAIAAPTSAGDFPERYAYILNSDSTVAVIKYQESSPLIAGNLGWTPWSGAGQITWLSAFGSDVVFSSSYFGTSVVEILDTGRYLDAAVAVNNLPAAMAAPVGKGPLWWIPNQTVTLMDLGTWFMGRYQIDADGFIIPKNIGGEDLASAQLVAGQPWVSTFEPFLPPVQGGQTVGQRMKRRKVGRWQVVAQHATGFVFADTRVTAYRQGDDALLAPTLREETVTGRRMGRDFDPRIPLVKEVPGPFTLFDLGLEITI